MSSPTTSPRAAHDPRGASFWERVQAEAARVHADEEGSTIVFAAITLFALTVSIVFVFQMGMVSADRLQIQSAADAAAYSGAQVQANAYNAIAQLNDGQSYVHYIMLRHAVDRVVYATLHYYESSEMMPTPASGQYGYVLMGGNQQPFEGRARIQRISNLSSVWQQGANWLNDLSSASRLIVFSTPQLVRQTAATVAGLNGASHIAFSRDLEQGMRVGDGQGEGFTDEAYRDQSSQDSASKPLYDRYQYQKLAQVTRAANGPQSETVAQKLPRVDWFDYRSGQVRGEYYQVRICWNTQDWDHRGATPHTGGVYSQFPPGTTPNAHWHQMHIHQIQIETPMGPVIVPQQHGPEPGGHGPPADDEPQLHEQSVEPVQPHHAVQACLTCNTGGRNPRPMGGRSQYAEIKASSRQSQVAQQVVNQINQFFRDVVPKGHIALKEDALRSGVTVATWRESHSIGNQFPASPWGMIAVASAQVGYQTDQGVLPLTQLQNGTATYQGRLANGNQGNDTVPYWTANATDPKNRNLFYDERPGSQQPQHNGGLRFGARLVPIARDLTYNSATGAGRSLQEILGGGGRWYTTGNSPQPTGAPQGLQQLRGFVSVDQGQGAEAFWH
ncbi:MAG: pilus assembly protein TadG-related protein [Planctomycetota bacterium]